MQLKQLQCTNYSREMGAVFQSIESASTILALGANS